MTRPQGWPYPGTKKARIIDALKRNERPTDIARLENCSIPYVSHVKSEMREFDRICLDLHVEIG